MIQKENFQTILFSYAYESKNTQKVYGIHRMSTELRLSGFTCQVVHFFVRFTDDELKKLIYKLVGDKTLVIGFSSTFFSWGSEQDKQNILRKAKLLIEYAQIINPSVKIIIGGAGPLKMIEYDEDFRKKVSAVFSGFPEEMACNYIKTLYEKSDPPTPTKLIYDSIMYYNTDGDNFKFTKSQIIYAPEDYIEQNEAVVIEVARGCIFKCKFCTFRLNGKKKFDYIKDPEVLREELIRNYNDYKIQYYTMSDDTFNDSTEKVKILHEVFTSLPFKIKFSTYLRLDLLYYHREQITLLKEMGLSSVMFGVESFNHEAAKSIGKGLDGKTSKQFLKELKDIYWGDNVKIEIALITGLPYETIESYNETKKWIEDQSVNIDLIRTNALRLENPNVYKLNSSISQFSKNASTYGFYWKDDSNFWYNDKSEIKNYKQALDMMNELYQTAKNSSKFAHGGFTLFSLWNIIQELNKQSNNPLTFDDLLNMSRIEFTKWHDEFFKPNKNYIKQNYIINYKKNFGL